MTKDKILPIITYALYGVSILAMLIYLIIDMRTYHAPKIYFTIGLIFLFVASIFALVTGFLRKRQRK